MSTQEAYEELYEQLRAMSLQAKEAYRMDRPDLIQRLIDVVTRQYMALSEGTEREITVDDTEDYARLIWAILDIKQLLRELAALKEDCDEPDHG